MSETAATAGIAASGRGSTSVPPAGWVPCRWRDRDRLVILAVSTVAIVAIAAVIIIALIALIYIVPRGGRRRR
jgi:hypothetical protein